MDDERYEYIKAIVDCGDLRWEYRLDGANVTGRDSHDEDVSDWTEQDIVALTMGALDVSEDQKDLIQVEYA